MKSARAQLPWLDTIAGVMLFMAFLAEAAYLTGHSEAGLAAYVHGASSALASNASVQSASYLLAEGNASAAALEATGMDVTKLVLEGYPGAANHAYNGSRLVVIDGSIYIVHLKGG